MEIWKKIHQNQMKNSLNWRKCYFLWPDNSRRDKKRQQSSVNLGHLFHKFPGIGWNR
jgi:hypothetical protein